MSLGVQIESLWRGLHDEDGNPLAGGFVYTYESGSSTTAKATYTDSALTTQSTNPIALDSEGRALVFATSGQYRFVINDSSGTTLRTLDGLTYQPVEGTVYLDVDSYLIYEGGRIVLYKDGAEVQAW